MRLINGLLALLLCATPVRSAVQEVAQFCGLDDTDAGNVIPDCAAESALNVETNLGATIIGNRQGFTQQAAIGIATAPVSGSTYFRDSSGNDIIVVCNGTNCASSKNGGAFSIFYSTASPAATQFSFVSIEGVLYGADNAHDDIWTYDGIDFISTTTIPACSILALDQDRMICANTTDDPNGVNYSQSGNYSNWTPGVNSPDPFEDYDGTTGDQITGISYWLGVLYIFKQYSIEACIPGDQFTTTCTQLNAFVGTNDPNSIVQAPDGLYFKGTDGNFWKYDGYYFTITSLRIQNTIKTFANGSSGFNIQTGQEDWNLGTQNAPGSWNAASIAGSIFPSTAEFIDNTSAAFSSGTVFTFIDTNTVANQVQLTSVTADDNWSGSTTAGALGWSVTQGAYVLVTDAIQSSAPGGECSLSANNPCTISTSQVKISSGDWQITHYWSSSFDNECLDVPACFEFRFMKNSGGSYFAAFMLDDGGNPTSSNKLVGLLKSVAGTLTIISSTTINYPQNTDSVWEIQRSTDGRMNLFINNVFVSSSSADVSISSSVKVEIESAAQTNAGSTYNGFTNFHSYQYAPNGQFVSRIFDTAFSTPTWGPFSSTFTVATNNIEGQVNFFTRVSTSPNNDDWDAWEASSDTVFMTNAQKRYTQYEANLYTFISTKTPHISAVEELAATTGTFVTQCVNPPSTITGWGILNCGISLGGEGALTFYTASASSCGGLPSAFQTSGWTVTANNSVISIATNTAIAVRFNSALTSSTDTAQVNACTVNWQTGVPAPPVWGIYTPVNNAIYWSGDVGNSTVTNRTFKYDMNNGGWFPLDLPMQAPLFYKNALYFGNGNGGYWDLYGQGAYSDNGNPINSHWSSKDWNLSEAFQEKSILAVSLVAINEGSGSLTVEQSADGFTPSSFTTNIGTTTTTSYIRQNYKIPMQSPFTFYSVEFSNDAANNPWSVLGYRMDYTLLPWRVLGPP